MGSSPFVFRIMGMKFTRIFSSSEKLEPEQRLWRAVVLNALEDCMNTGSDRKTSLQKIRAHNWVLNKDEDFETVCYWASVEPDDINETYKGALFKKNIRFTSRQVMWFDYDKLYQKMLASEQPIEKRKFRKKVDLMRAKINTTPIAFVSTVFVSAFV